MADLCRQKGLGPLEGRGVVCWLSIICALLDRQPLCPVVGLDKKYCQKEQSRSFAALTLCFSL